MDVPDTEQSTPSQPQHSQPSRQRRPRRDGEQARGDRNMSLSLRPATVAPKVRARQPPPFPPSDQSQGSSAPESEATHATDRSRGRGRGRGQGRGRGGRASEMRTVNGRTFGGQLTAGNNNVSEALLSNSQLQANAAVFMPGQDQNHVIADNASRNSRVKQARPLKQRLPKSDAPDIATRTHDDIDNGHYECPICTSEVRRNSKVWSCHTCWTVFHLTCVKKWSSNEGSAASRQNPQDGVLPPPRQWRCPGCNLPKDDLPSTYNCWCGKETDPRPLSGLPPHSCGQTCAKERVRRCPHPCQLTCHAGPCPPCTHMGPTQSCFCGKHEATKRCSETRYDSGWGCGEPCEKTLSCGEHRCTNTCHEGPCSTCDVVLRVRCYCGQMDKDVLCSDRGEMKDSRRLHNTTDGETLVENWTGCFDCGNQCGRTFDCGVHKCEKICHPQIAEHGQGHCPRSPDAVTHCPCGKTPLNELIEIPRASCEEPIPACKKSCQRPLACGHSCPKICHSGECPPCTQTVLINCRCGRTTSNTICHQGKEEPPQCVRVCRANLNCGRHACEERCCPGERKAIERQATKRKQRPLSSAPRHADDGIEAEHICTRQCGRLLKCSNHVCEELCHKGPCGTCREAIFDEITCHCGRTVLQPPLPCGTQPPPCRLPCQRPKACGHPQVGHSCHQDADDCPRCPFLVARKCLCGKTVLKNQQCWFQDVRCGQICGRKLKCGVHFCRKTCHRLGECEDADGQPCQQPCGKEKKICDHPDDAPCHAPYPCKEDKPCHSKIFITCDCQVQKLEMKCGASKSSAGNVGKSLPCNDECAKLERNRKLALALNIDQATHVEGGDHIPFSTDTLNYFAQHVKWSQNQEREFRVFAAADEEKRLRFKPMQPQQRAFVHSLAEDFGLDSESVDPEPHRHVLIWKTPRFVSAPNKTLADALRIRQQNQRTANVSANVSDNEGGGVSKTKVAKIIEPYNGFVISNTRFGLTIEEVRAEVNKVVNRNNPFTFDIEFLPSEEVVLKAISRTLPPADLEGLLQNLKFPIATAIATKGFGSAQLCTADSSLNITRLESTSMGGGDGWSRVAAKKAAPKINVQGGGFGATNPFAALSGDGKVKFARKKPEKLKPEPIVDDWEAAELAEEEREKVASASASEDDGGVKADETFDIIRHDGTESGADDTVNAVMDVDVGGGGVGGMLNPAVTDGVVEAAVDEVPKEVTQSESMPETHDWASEAAPS